MITRDQPSNSTAIKTVWDVGWDLRCWDLSASLRDNFWALIKHIKHHGNVMLRSLRDGLLLGPHYAERSQPLDQPMKKILVLTCAITGLPRHYMHSGILISESIQIQWNIIMLLHTCCNSLFFTKFFFVWFQIKIKIVSTKKEINESERNFFLSRYYMNFLDITLCRITLFQKRRV